MAGPLMAEKQRSAVLLIQSTRGLQHQLVQYILIVQMERMRLKKEKELAQGHTGGVSG